jgi:hypothetical protein
MIYLKRPCKIKVVIHWNGNAFEKMKNLKTLIIEHGRFSKCPEYLPSTLRVLKWNGYRSKSPSSCVLNKVSEINSCFDVAYL